MKWLLRAGLLLGGVLLALAAVETALRLTHPRYAGAASNQWVADSDLGYYSRPNHSFQSANPDTGERHPVIHNSLGLRMSREPVLPPPDGTTLHAFFGDSFTENIGLPSATTFTETLHYLQNRDGGKAEVLNFGVDGYGPGQQLLAFRRFRQTHPGITLDHVYYLFCGNDLRNLYEARLLSLGADGELVQRTLRRQGSTLKLLRRLYLTYFLLEHGVISRPRLQALFGSEGTPPCENNRGSVMDCDFASERKRLRVKLRKELKADTERLMNGELGEDTPAGKLFFTVLRRWKEEVEVQGGAFHMLMLPDHGLRGLTEDLLRKKYSVISMIAAFRIGYPSAYQEEEMYFKNDGHWNGLANVLAADALNRWIDSGFTKQPVMQGPAVDPDLGPYLTAVAPRLLPPLFNQQQRQTFKERPAAEREAIRRTYTALEKE